MKNPYKFLMGVMVAALIIPAVSFAANYTIPWSTPSLTLPDVSPVTIDGQAPSVTIGGTLTVSTTTTSLLANTLLSVVHSNLSVTDNYSNQNYISNLNDITQSPGQLQLTQAVCGTYTVTGSDGLTYGTVLGADGNCWLDRNLGATEVANSSTDYNAYGSLFQWGRLADGHQQITWTSSTTGTPVYGATTTLSSTDNPGTNEFIEAPNSPNDWRSPQNNNLWQGVSGTNNPCPSGFEVPTQAQWATLVSDAGITNAATAFSSSLKLPSAGYRLDNSSLVSQGSAGLYWSSGVNGTSAYDLYLFSSGMNSASYNDRAYGASVRCVKG